jgi:osmotically-inducible protein OsmY
MGAVGITSNPGSARRTDVLIRDSVLVKLNWDARVSANLIGVTVQDGIVTLSGTVDSPAQRWAAQQAALRVQWVKAVTNAIAVSRPQIVECSRSDTEADTKIAQVVARALRWTPYVPLGAVQVEVTHGWVTLIGTVDTKFQRRQAEYAVHHLAGVKGVTNAIRVRTAEPVPADLRQRIEY